jgi:hypothetical protein
VSPIEEGLLFHDFYCVEGVYVDQMICDVAGVLDVSLFEETLHRLVKLHEILRTLYARTGTGIQATVAHRAAAPKLPFHDLSTTPDARAIAMRRIEADARRPLDPAREVSRCSLYRLDDRLHVFSWIYHHVLADSWTLRLLQQQFCSIYRGLMEGRVPEQKTTPYSDYVRWIEDQDRESALGFWSDYLERRPRRAKQVAPAPAASSERASIRIDLPSDARAHLDEVRRGYRVTLNIAILAMWGILAISRRKTSDCVLGCAVFGRSVPLKGINAVAGVCSNTVPVVISEDMPLSPLLSGLQRTVLVASGRSYLSLSDILATAGLSHRDLHSVVNFTIDKPEVDTADSARLPFRVTNVRYTQAASFDAYVDVEVGEEAIALTVHFDRGQRVFDVADDRRACAVIARAMAEHADGTVRDVLDELLLENGAFDAGFDFGAGRLA